MAGKVVDASALAALAFGEPEAEGIARRLGRSPLFAPALLQFEIADVCLKKIIRHPELKESLLAAFRLTERLAIETVHVDREQTLALALEKGLSAYDASYLLLARSLGAELVTLDSRLASAAVS